MTCTKAPREAEPKLPQAVAEAILRDEQPPPQILQDAVGLRAGQASERGDQLRTDLGLSRVQVRDPEDPSWNNGQQQSFQPEGVK
eukprot:CAMPEP_0170509724 /NCGR_PEP_ID=MMETSP0208-20121228/65371_1 /TAXON_ID=197538 /ORGANISM="Strombidium inclinatum, Strain S3" /LENGTH=84 /DNA_ID=CAMNT_0010793109 /DNA_START=912 /DNA_END=1167 /DNA_ORIENTATION=-